jgi:DNA polymerase III subunit epsilon
MRQLILDTETTGLEVAKGHRIIEFAALEMIDRKLTGNHLHLYINPEREIDPDATRIHGIKNSDVADKPVFNDVAIQISEYIKDAELIIHNAKFDLAFLNYQFNLSGLKLIDEYVKNVIDTLIMARQKFSGSKNNLDALCDRFKISRENRNYHGALIDCQLLAEVYLAMTREQVSLIGIEDDKIHNNKKYEFNKIDLSGLNLRVIHPSIEENQKHDEYLKTLDKISHGNSTWFNLVKNSQ